MNLPERQGAPPGQMWSACSTLCATLFFKTAGRRLQAMPQLTEADAAAAAGLVLRRMPREHAAIVHSMGPQPELQYKYLKVGAHFGLPVPSHVQ